MKETHITRREFLLFIVAGTGGLACNLLTPRGSAPTQEPKTIKPIGAATPTDTLNIPPTQSLDATKPPDDTESPDVLYHDNKDRFDVIGSSYNNDNTASITIKFATDKSDTQDGFTRMFVNSKTVCVLDFSSDGILEHCTGTSKATEALSFGEDEVDIGDGTVILKDFKSKTVELKTRKEFESGTRRGSIVYFVDETYSQLEAIFFDVSPNGSMKVFSKIVDN